MMTQNQIKNLGVSLVFGIIGLTSAQLIGGGLLWNALAIPVAPVVPVAAYVGLWAVQAAIVLGIGAIALRALSPSPVSTDRQLPELTEEDRLRVQLQTSEFAETSRIFETETATKA